MFMKKDIHRERKYLSKNANVFDAYFTHVCLYAAPKKAARESKAPPSLPAESKDTPPPVLESKSTSYPYVNLPSIWVPQTSVSLYTCRQYLSKLGYTRRYWRKGTFFDGHDIAIEKTSSWTGSCTWRRNWSKTKLRCIKCPPLRRWRCI